MSHEFQSIPHPHMLLEGVKSILGDDPPVDAAGVARSWICCEAMIGWAERVAQSRPYFTESVRLGRKMQTKWRDSESIEAMQAMIDVFFEAWFTAYKRLLNELAGAHQN